MKETAYEKVLIELAKKEVRFILCGGMALFLRHIKRNTLDIDLAVDLEEENLRIFVGVMTDLGWKPRISVPATDFIDAENRRKWREEKNAVVFTFTRKEQPLLAVDVFLDQLLPFEELFADVETVMLRDVEIPVASYAAILKMKEQIDPPRPKDELDIRMLRSIVKKRAE